MNHYFDRMRPAILNEHNIDTLSALINQFVDEAKGEIEASRTKLCGSNEPKQGPIKVLNPHREPKGDQK